jgi:hypothetical protein
MKHKRIVKDTPVSLVDEFGKFEFGMFKTHFKEFNFQRFNSGLFKKFKNKWMLTEWQAVEVLAENLFLITAIFKFGPMNKMLLLAYDIEEEKLYDYSETSFFRNKSFVAPTLEKGSTSYRESRKSNIKIINHLEEGRLTLNGYHEDVIFDVEFEKISEPSIICIEMDDEKFVYTEKDLLVPNGSIQLNEKIYPLNEKNITILDDHRGYYPLTSGYDWVTTMGTVELNGVQHKFGLNITDFYKNKISEVHENGYWLNETFCHLPTASFRREQDTWYIQDDEGVIDLVFTVKKTHKEQKKFPLTIDYILAFGSISGSIKTELSEINIKDMFGLAEKRKTKSIFNS